MNTTVASFVPRGADRTMLELDASKVQRFVNGAVLRGRYRLAGELGRGGMGVVYRATDLELGRDVAIKVVPEHYPAAARQRLLQEARTAATLNHAHIVTVHDVGEESGLPFFVMELIEGRNLRDAALRSFDEIVHVAVQLCDALDHAHAHGLVHRDLKPENVLLVGDSQWVKLADLGIAVPARDSRLTGSGFITGTVAYMAPEQALGEAVDARADLYSVGILLYELAVGRVPFTGDDPLRVVSQHVNAPVVPPHAIRPDVPPALEAVILKLLAKQPGERYATAADARLALTTARLSESSDAHQSPPAVAVLDALSRGRLVGRRDELAAANELWRRARKGHGHCVLLTGEPGAGKTRLARELMIQVAVDGGTTLGGACYEYEAMTPYLPFVEAFRSWVRTVPDDGVLRRICGDLAPLVARLAPEIETRLGPFPERPALAAHEERLLLFDAVADMLRAVATDGGLLFYIDDLQWADGGTVALLGHMLRRLHNDRVLLAASYRETELDRTHPLAAALVDWNRERLTTRIVLRRLGPAETREQLSALLGQTAGDGLATAVHRETEGNPFFVEEMLKALIEQGAVRREGNQWSYAAPGELRLPESLRAAIGRRLDRVGRDTNEMLRAAAVLGKTFGIAELQAVAVEFPEDTLIDALDEAVAAQLVVAGRDGGFAFTHDKIRETLYDELNPIRRRRMHLRTAEGLEKRRRTAAVSVEKLAHHFVHAGEHQRALAYAREAAAEAERLFAYDEAIAAYRRALDCAEALGHRQDRAAIEEAIGKALVLSGDQMPAIDHFERALALVTDPLDRARLHTEMASSLVITGDPRGLEYARQALFILNPAMHPVETANAIAIEGRFHHLAGRHRDAIRSFERAAALLTPQPARGRLESLAASTETFTYAYLAGAYQHLGLFADSNEWARRVLEFGRTRGMPVAEAFGCEFLAENAMSTGEWQQGLESALREREIARRLHSREREAWTYLPGGVCAFRSGDSARSETELTSGIALATAIGERRLLVLLQVMLSCMLADIGRTDEALTLAEQAVEQGEALGLLFTRTEAKRALAHARFRRGELDEALRLCDEILGVLVGMEPRVTRLYLGPTHVEALVGAGRFDQARGTLDTYTATVAQCQSPYFTSEVARLRSLVDAAGTQPAQAVAART